MKHTTVLLHEAVAALKLTPTATVVDATLGAGGHSAEILTQLTAGGTLVAIDTDQTALDAVQLPETKATVHLVHDNFSHIREILSSLQIDSVDAILADLGWRSEQFAEGGKGLSFQNDEPLLMTFGDPADYPFTAYDIVNEWEEEVLANIFYGYADERFARRIARTIMEERQVRPIATTNDLVAVVTKALPKVALRQKHHPATRTFQALRIAVNDELTVLERFLDAAFTALAPNGRLAIITFHSIEDRIVKHTFKNFVAADVGQLITKKPLVPDGAELAENPRARSAKLRIIEKF